jgi:hypothetical protein
MKNPDNFAKNTIDRYLADDDDNPPPKSYAVDKSCAVDTVIKMLIVANRKAIQDHLQSIFDYVRKSADSTENLADGTIYNFHKGFRSYNVVESVGDSRSPDYLCIDMVFYNLLNAEHSFYNTISASVYRHSMFENAPFEDDNE